LTQNFDVIQHIWKLTFTLITIVFVIQHSLKFKRIILMLDILSWSLHNFYKN